MIPSGRMNGTRTLEQSAEAKFEKGLAVARRFIGTKYSPWKPGDDEKGPPLWTDRIPSVLEMRLRGAVCGAVVNVFLLANDTKPPAPEGWLPGGTGAYGEVYDRPEYGISYSAFHPRGTLFGSPYAGPEHTRQGHVAVAVEDGVNPLLIQSILGAGWYENDRLETMHPFTYAVPPEIWLG